LQPGDVRIITYSVRVNNACPNIVYNIQVWNRRGL
jgi:hypothetical protein